MRYATVSDSVQCKSCSVEEIQNASMSGASLLPPPLAADEFSQVPGSNKAADSLSGALL